ncbi:hypothetical protein IT072_04320 [Leifsonia sp. ZF2019]|uniref:hypothetical protein n=1 Tax=Leifsonia sp. ZF2019 TaxID=2781978 RepID=UPI001CC118A0|nr:hypothetical protein [Leifsonia sp. ZF2019]UAJ80280.1 hypothetical protein IT072_04320 [Leifsonia sp. ZF2019]
MGPNVVRVRGHDTLELNPVVRLRDGRIETIVSTLQGTPKHAYIPLAGQIGCDVCRRSWRKAVGEGFRYSGPRTIESHAGESVEILGRAGLRVRIDGQEIPVSSEMLAGPGLRIHIYSSSIPATGPISRSRVLEVLTAAFAWAGYDIEIIDPSQKVDAPSGMN